MGGGIFSQVVLTSRGAGGGGYPATKKVSSVEPVRAGGGGGSWWRPIFVCSHFLGEGKKMPSCLPHSLAACLMVRSRFVLASIGLNIG